MPKPTQGQLKRLVLSLAAAIVLICSAHGVCAEAASFETFEEFSFGFDNLNYQRNRRIINEIHAFLINGKRISYPPDQTTIDNTLRGILRTGYSHIFTPKIGASVLLTTRNSLHKEHTKDLPRRILEENYTEVNPSLDFHFVTHGGLDFIMGMQLWYQPSHKRKIETASLETTTTYGSWQMMAPRLSIIKPSGTGGFGVFYQEGASTTQGIVTRVNSENEPPLTGSRAVYRPKAIGFVGRFESSRGTIDAEFSALHAAGEGTQKPDGSRSGEDYQRLRIGYSRPINETINWRVLLSHNTLSYARSEDMNLGNVPVTALHFRIRQGSESHNAFLSAIYGISRDTASIPELNQRFEMLTVGASAGINFTF